MIKNWFIVLFIKKSFLNSILHLKQVCAYGNLLSGSLQYNC
jgi:hypothetical protein